MLTDIHHLLQNNYSEEARYQLASWGITPPLCDEILRLYRSVNSYRGEHPSAQKYPHLFEKPATLNETDTTYLSFFFAATLHKNLTAMGYPLEGSEFSAQQMKDILAQDTQGVLSQYCVILGALESAKEANDSDRVTEIATATINIHDYIGTHFLNLTRAPLGAHRHFVPAHNRNHPLPEGVSPQTNLPSRRAAQPPATQETPCSQVTQPESDATLQPQLGKDCGTSHIQ